MINGSFWVGAALGALVAVALLNPSLVDPELGWRLAFLTGAAIGLVVFTMRMWIPESPRWLAIHGREAEGEAAVTAIEKRFIEAGVDLAPVPEGAAIRLRSRTHTPLREVFDALFNRYRLRSFVGLTLMAAQAFFYNAVFFTYALILTNFYGIPAGQIGWYILPFAAGNVLGPIVLGRLFDTIGRKTMIAATYGISGVLLAVTGYLFSQGVLSAQMLTVAWMIVFFFASAAASSAYLTVSEIFPLEIRASAIAFFYAIGTGVGGVAGPLLLGELIDTGSRSSVALGYALGAVLMIAAAVGQAIWGVAAERKSLETVARPLSFVE
jgi:MFS family permease